MYHLYDDKDTSNLELNDYEIKLKNEREKAERDRIMILEDLKKKKINYEPGVWNASSVFLGGLGIFF